MRQPFTSAVVANRQRARLIVLVAGTILGVAVAFPIGVIASHHFSDVPTSNAFHDDIDAIADAGVTTGCALGLYCPKDFVTREQMAAFLNRLGALEAGTTPVVNADKVDGLTAGQFLRSDVAYTGRESCSGPTLQTLHESLLVYGQRALVSNGKLWCDVRLPDGATITGFSGTLIDWTAAGNWSCFFHRYSKVSMMEPATIGSFVTTDAFHGGNFFGSDSSIDDPVVDNETYIYLPTCITGEGGGSLLVNHLDVTYSVTGHGQP